MRLKKADKPTPELIQKIIKASEFFINPGEPKKIRMGTLHIGICRLVGGSIGDWRLRRLITQTMKARGLREIRIRGYKYFAAFPASKKSCYERENERLQTS